MNPTSILSITLQILTTTTILLNPSTTKAQPLFPAILVFGDSSVDTGNNHHLGPRTLLNRADHPPYGRDFPSHTPTGRYSNGKLIPDFMAAALGLKDSVPPFLSPSLSDKDLLTGVSFASGGSGYDEVTSGLTGAIPMSRQVEYLREYLEKIRKIVGGSEAKRIVKEGVVVVSAGSNDFVLNFYDLPIRRVEFNISGYQDFILQRLQSFIEEIYKEGCRTIIVSGLPPIGCIPIQITAKFKDPKARACLDDQNLEAQSYNDKLRGLLPRLQSSLPGSRLFYADTYTPLMQRIIHPQTYGLRVQDRGCCGTGFYEVGALCNSLTPTCRNASEYVFWDSIHPTESTYQYIFIYLIQDIGSDLIGDDSLTHKLELVTRVFKTNVMSNVTSKICKIV